MMMSKKIGLFVAVMTVCFGVASCDKKEEISPILSHYQSATAYEFTKDYITALTFLRDGQDLRTAFDQAEAFDETKYGKGDDYQMAAMVADLMKSMRHTTSYFSKAQAQISGYKNSSDAKIKLASEKTELAMAEIITMSHKLLEQVENIWTNETPETFNHEAAAVTERRLHAEMDLAYELLADSAVLVTHTLVSDIPDENGYLSSLTITEGQKQDWMSSMEQAFDPMPKFADGIPYRDGAVAGLHHFLTTSDHKTK